MQGGKCEGSASPNFRHPQGQSQSDGIPEPTHTNTHAFRYDNVEL